MCVFVSQLSALKVVLKDIRVTGPRRIEADWVLGGWLRTEFFPWQAKVEPFTGNQPLLPVVVSHWWPPLWSGLQVA
jgi:hypothetical protein